MYKEKQMAAYKFIEYTSILDNSVRLWALAEDAVIKTIDNVKFIEVTTDFASAQLARIDNLKPVGQLVRNY
jgi:hypothetical protein